MEFAEVLIKRRSCRCFDADAEISREELLEILEETQQAPSWQNLQGGRYYIAESKEAMDAVYQSLHPYNKRVSKGCSYYILSTYVKGKSGSNEWSAYDLGLQNAYFCLAATSHGLDTLIMGSRDEAVLREYFHIPEEEVLMPVIALGKAEGKLPCMERLPLREIVTEK